MKTGARINSDLHPGIIVSIACAFSNQRQIANHQTLCMYLRRFFIGVISADIANMGIAYEVCSAIMEYAKEELGIDKLYSCIDKNNKPSISLIHKLGFKVYAQDIDGMNIYICEFN